MITRLELENVKAFKRLDLGLGSLTLMSGTNSSGKSTVLQSLALIHQSLVQSPNIPTLLLNGEFVSLGVGRDVRHEQWESATDEPTISVAVTENGRRVDLRARYQADAEYLELSEESGRAWGFLGSTSLGEKRFQYIRADRIGPMTSYPRSLHAVSERRTVGSRGEFAVDFLRINQDDLIVPPVLRHETGTGGTLISQTEAWLGVISPGTNLDVSTLEGTDTVRLSFRLGRAGFESTNPYRPTNVGFGLAYSLPIIVAALASRPGDLLLVENPEAHLHPAGQSSIGSLLVAAAANGAQVMIETHSEHVLNAVRIDVRSKKIAAEDTRLHFLTRHEKGQPHVQSPEINPDGSLNSWPDGFFDQWESALVKLLDG